MNVTQYYEPLSGLVVISSSGMQKFTDDLGSFSQIFTDISSGNGKFGIDFGWNTGYIYYVSNGSVRKVNYARTQQAVIAVNDPVCLSVIQGTDYMLTDLQTMSSEKGLWIVSGSSNSTLIRIDNDLQEELQRTGFKNITALVSDSDGNCYFVSQSKRKVYRLSYDSLTLHEFDLGYKPRDIALDKNRDFWVVGWDEVVHKYSYLADEGRIVERQSFDPSRYLPTPSAHREYRIGGINCEKSLSANILYVVGGDGHNNSWIMKHNISTKQTSYNSGLIMDFPYAVQPVQSYNSDRLYVLGDSSKWESEGFDSSSSSSLSSSSASTSSEGLTSVSTSSSESDQTSLSTFEMEYLYLASDDGLVVLNIDKDTGTVDPNPVVIHQVSNVDYRAVVSEGNRIYCMGYHNVDGNVRIMSYNMTGDGELQHIYTHVNTEISYPSGGNTMYKILKVGNHIYQSGEFSDLAFVGAFNVSDDGIISDVDPLGPFPGMQATNFGGPTGIWSDGTHLFVSFFLDRIVQKHLINADGTLTLLLQAEVPLDMISVTDMWGDANYIYIMGDNQYPPWFGNFVVSMFDHNLNGIDSVTGARSGYRIWTTQNNIGSGKRLFTVGTQAYGTIKVNTDVWLTKEYSRTCSWAPCPMIWGDDNFIYVLTSNNTSLVVMDHYFTIFDNYDLSHISTGFEGISSTLQVPK